jgi:TRAP-type uncharacterized transport system fused permease subunit
VIATLANAGRLVFLAALVFIVGNAVADSVNDERIALAALELLAFPVTFLAYPVLAREDGSAWPVGDPLALPVALAVALVVYGLLLYRDRAEHRYGARVM